MTDPNRPPFFSYGSYPSSSDFRENEPVYSDWTSSQFPQAHFGPQINYEPSPSYVENPAGPRVGTAERSVNSKVAIPRSANPSSWTSSGRVSRACENCREQKAKCSGHRPTCQRCQESGIRCSYGDRKREKMANKTRHCGLNFWGCMASTIHLSSSAHQYLYGECHGEKAGRWFCAQAARCRHKALRFAF